MLAGSLQVIAVDLRGAGLSEKLIGPVEQDFARDINAFIQALGSESVDVIGVAAGAVIAATLAIRNPMRVRNLILANMAHTLDDDARRALIERAVAVRRDGMRSIWERTSAASFSADMEELKAAYAPIFLSNDPVSYSETVLAVSRMKIPEADLRALRCRTCVLGCERDPIWPSRKGQMVAELVPRSEFHILREAAHFPHTQRPETLASHILAFLGRG